MSERFIITKDPIVIEDVVKKVERREAGAVTTFIGTVREWTNGKKTLYLEYEAYVPMAVSMLAQIGKEINEKWPGTAQPLPIASAGWTFLTRPLSSPCRRLTGKRRMKRMNMRSKE